VHSCPSVYQVEIKFSITHWTRRMVYNVQCMFFMGQVVLAKLSLLAND
jgi:hypothetical protein